MTDLERVRDVAMLLPEAEVNEQEGCVLFTVDGRTFTKVEPGAIFVRTDDQALGDASDDERGWCRVTLSDDTDWPLIEDRIARSWELTAPRRLLEAGGR